METLLEDRDGARCLRLQGELTIYAAATVKAALLDALAGTAELDVDLAEVTEIDTAGVQLLVAAKREALEAGTTLRLGGHSAAVVELIELLGLAGWFGDPLVLPAQAEGVAA